MDFTHSSMEILINAKGMLGQMFLGLHKKGKINSFDLRFKRSEIRKWVRRTLKMATTTSSVAKEGGL